MWQVTMNGRPRYTGPPCAGKTQCPATHEFSTLSREASTESFQLKMLFCTVGLIVNFHLSSFQQNTWFSEVVSRETSIETSESKQGGFDLKFFTAPRHVSFQQKMLFWNGFPEKLPWLASSSFSHISWLPPSPLLELPSTTNFACSLWTTCRWTGASDHSAPVNDQLCLVTNLSCLVTADNLSTRVTWLYAGYLVYNWGGGEMSSVITRPSHLAKCH